MPLSQFVEDIACQNVYTLMILKRSDRFRWAWIVRSKMYVRYSTINDENKYKSKDHLFIFKTTIMVNKREKIYCIISISDKRLSSFFFFFNFIPFLLLFSSFFPIFFVLILSYLSGTCTFFFANIFGWNFLSSFGHFWAELFSQVGEGVHLHPVQPPCVRAWTFIHEKPYAAWAYSPTQKTEPDFKN